MTNTSLSNSAAYERAALEQILSSRRRSQSFLETSPRGKESHYEPTAVKGLGIQVGQGSATSPKSKRSSRPAPIQIDSNRSSLLMPSPSLREVGPEGYRPFKPHSPVDPSSNLATLVQQIENQHTSDHSFASYATTESEGTDLLESDTDEDEDENDMPDAIPKESEKLPFKPIVELRAAKEHAATTRSPVTAQFPTPPGSPETDNQNGTFEADPQTPKIASHPSSTPPLNHEGRDKLSPLRNNLDTPPDTARQRGSAVVQRRYQYSKITPATVDNSLLSQIGVNASMAGSQASLRTRPSFDSRSIGASDISRKPSKSSLSYEPPLPNSSSQANMGEWAPLPNPTLGSNFGIDNLPDWSQIEGTNKLTAVPIQRVRRDMDFSLRRLISEEVFEKLLDDPVGCQRFREYLSMTESDSLTKLDMYMDLRSYERLAAHFQATSKAIHEVYLVGHRADRAEVPIEHVHELYERLKIAVELPSNTGHVQNHLLRSMYHNELQRFIKKQLVDQASVRLGKIDLGDEERDGLGDCFCLTNPRLRENPIVLVSEGFVAVTGYPREAIIGRNCRFLQGPGTAPASIQRVRDALNRGEGICELLLNYRRDATPFWNLLNIVPLRDSAGRLVYFIGGQTNVSGTLANSSGLAFLVGGPSVTGKQPHLTANGYTVSPPIAHALRGLPVNPKLDIQGALPVRETASTADSLLDDSKSSLSGRQTLVHQRSGMFNKVKGLFRSRGPESQQIVGAEANLRTDELGLEEQMEYFASAYSSLLIFKRHKREIIFATPHLLRSLGVTDQRLLHTDLIKILEGADKAETKTIRQNIKGAVKAGVEFSVAAAAAPPSRLGMRSGSDRKLWLTIHMTPLRDARNDNFAFVAVFS